jgi:hypothetical protein
VIIQTPSIQSHLSIHATAMQLDVRAPPIARPSFLASSSLPASSAPLPFGVVRSRVSLRREVEEACRTFDQGRKGYITSRELKYIFVSCMGYKPTKVRPSRATLPACARRNARLHRVHLSI